MHDLWTELRIFLPKVLIFHTTEDKFRSVLFEFKLVFEVFWESQACHSFD